MPDDPQNKPADMKATRNAAAANTGRDRPKLSILPYNGQVYAAGATSYGGDKYSRGNYFGPPPAKVAPVDRFLEYLDAAQRHIGKIAQAINVAKGTGGDQRAACALPDDEASGGFPASNLPHIAHAIAGLMIAVECGITDDLLPVDPGQPWKRDPMYAEVLARRGAAPAALAQKDDPDAERRRVALAPLYTSGGSYDLRAAFVAGKIDESLVRGADATEPCPHIAHERLEAPEIKRVKIIGGSWHIGETGFVTAQDGNTVTVRMEHRDGVHLRTSRLNVADAGPQ